MASAGAGSKPSNGHHRHDQSSSRVVVQDYIARIRYSNSLPAPPTPPKLLDIPSAGMSQYTAPGFATRLAREQPMTIEPDAELGMPIDMVGVPGVFFGDDSAIMASEPVLASSLHPADRALLRPFSSLGSSTSSGNAAVTFLRRTEYITASGTRNDSSAFIKAKQSSALFGSASNDRSGPASSTSGPVGRKQVNKNDPVYISRHILKGFDLAYPYDKYTGPEVDGEIRSVEPTAAEREAWERPRHPTNPAVKPLDFYPVLPDFAATPDTGSYIIMKFKTNPVGQSSSYDERLDVGLFHVVDPKPEDLEKYQEQMAARDRDPSLPPVMPQYDFDLFLPDTGSTAVRLKRRMSVYAPDRDDDLLYDSVRTDDQARAFKLQRVRRYETYQQTGSGPEAPFAESVGIALHDPDHSHEDGVDPSVVGLPKAAFLYGIGQRTSIRAKRKGGPGGSSSTGTTGPDGQLINGAVEEDTPADAIELTIRDKSRRELRHVRQALLKYHHDLPGRVIPELAGEWEDEEEEEEDEEEAEQSQQYQPDGDVEERMDVDDDANPAASSDGEDRAHHQLHQSDQAGQLTDFSDED